MNQFSGDGVTSEYVGGKSPFWAVWSHRLEGEDATARAQAAPVLLIHAATLSRNMFLAREGGFVKALLKVHHDGRPRFDVRTLDWRSSKHLFGNFGEGGKNRSFEDYRIDRVVDDVSAGVKLTAGESGRRVHVVAHCLGAAATAQAIATGAVAAGELAHVVLATVALFYRVGLDGVLKTAENVMEGIEAQGVHALSPYAVLDGSDPSKDWPSTFKDMYAMWRDTIFPHGCGLELCDRLWFMYGGDYRADDMDDFHTRVRLTEHFGAMPVGLYRHIVDNCRRGWAAEWRSKQPKGVLDPEPFRGMSLTLITGSENQVWHRDSIDRMHEWLHRELGPRGAANVRKRVFDRYGHVDLWWSRLANQDGQVFPYLIDTLTR